MPASYGVPLPGLVLRVPCAIRLRIWLAMTITAGIDSPISTRMVSGNTMSNVVGTDPAAAAVRGAVEAVPRGIAWGSLRAHVGDGRLQRVEAVDGVRRIGVA